MDDMDLIERFRTDVAGAGAEARASARAALVRTIDGGRIENGRGPARAPRAKLRLVTAAVAGALALALVIPALLPGGREPSAAAETLRGAAQMAMSQPWVPIKPGQYVYTKTLAQWETTEGDETRLDDVVRETWIGPDGSGRIDETRGAIHWDDTFPAGEMHFEDLSALPTDVDGLRSYVEERASHADNPLDYEMFVVIGDLLRETYAPPEVRAGLYEVAADLSGVELLGPTSDESGRVGIGVAYANAGIQHVLIFDPGTSAVLGEREVILNTTGTSSGPAGRAEPETVPGSWTVYVDSGIVDSITERP